MKRTAVVIALGVLALGAAVALVPFRCGAPEESSAPAVTHRPPRRVLPGPATPTPPPSGSLSVRGRVLDRKGQPAAGVDVAATRSMPGESLSQLPCDEESPEVPLSSSDCPVEDLLLELVLEGRGGAPVLARTTSAEDGTFTLDGLPEGTVEVWAQGPGGSDMKPGVQAGAEGVELTLKKGLTLAGLVMDEAGTPLPGARVTVLHEEHSRYFETSTGADGRFEVGPLPEGYYTLVASSPGLLPELVNAVLPEEVTEIVLHAPRRLKGQVRSQGSPAPGAEVRLKDTSHVAVTDAQGRFSFEPLAPDDYEVLAERDGQHAVAFVTLSEEEPEAEATLHLGTVLYVEGTVRDDAGQPISGAGLSATSDGPSDTPEPEDVSTKADGRYRLGPLSPGNYRLNVDAEGYVDLEDQPVVVAPSGPPVDFVLTRAITIEGIVTDAEGRPLAEVELEAASLQPPEPEEEEGDSEESLVRRLKGQAALLERQLDSMFEGEHSATTGEDGRFLFEVPEPGRYVIQVIGGNFLFTRVETEAPARGVKLTLRGGAQVEGTVVDARDAPLFGVYLTVEVGRGEQRHEVGTQSNEEGHFTLSGLPPGTHVVQANYEVAGLSHRASRTVQVRGTETVDASLRIETGGSVSGIVVDEQGRPLADAKVYASSKDPEHQPRSLDDASAGRTGPDGRFTVYHLAQGDCMLYARKSGYTFVGPSATGRYGHRGTAVVDATVGARDVRLVMRYRGRIHGRVTRADGTPLPRFELNHVHIRDLEGRFTVDSEPGEYSFTRLTFEAPGLPRLVREVEVPPGQDLDLGDVRMEEGRQVRGRVVDGQTGAPVVDAEVRVSLPGEDPWMEENMPLAEVLTGADGSFALPLLEARPLRLQVEHDDYVLHRQPLGAGNETLDVRLYTGARLEGTVRDRNGQPMSATVRVMPTDRRVSRFTSYTTGVGVRTPQGSFVVERLSPGDYAVSVYPDSTGRGDTPYILPRRVRLPATGSVVLDFEEAVGTATLRLGVPAQPPPRAYDLDFGLVPGSVSPDAPAEELLSLVRNFAMRRIDSSESEHFFQGLPGGRYTVLMLAKLDSDRFLFHREEVYVPEGTELVHQVHPVWRPVPPTTR